MADVLLETGTCPSTLKGGGGCLSVTRSIPVLHQPNPDAHVVSPFPSSYLNLCNAEGGGQLGPLGQCEEVSPLEPALQVLELQRRVHGPWLSDLLPRGSGTGDQFPVLYVHALNQGLVLAWVLG